MEMHQHLPGKLLQHVIITARTDMQGAAHADFGRFLLARVGEDDDGPVIVLVSKLLDQVDQICVFYLLWREDVPLVQLLHCPCPVDNRDTLVYIFSAVGEQEHKQTDQTK